MEGKAVVVKGKIRSLLTQASPIPPTATPCRLSLLSSSDGVATVDANDLATNISTASLGGTLLVARRIKWREKKGGWRKMKLTCGSHV
uniref:Uncharacterized protein n=1 Tax=Oryza sativa subsp. japonica TaxID=39947 RepID=Q6ES96_ORYSJ|nr:hypothetical protein [Oryza sativa Japonica Group]